MFNYIQMVIISEKERNNCTNYYFDISTQCILINNDINHMFIYSHPWGGGARRRFLLHSNWFSKYNLFKLLVLIMNWLL